MRLWGGGRVRGGGEGATAHCQKLWPQGGPHRKGGRESETGKKPHEELASETAKDRKWESPWRAHDVGGEEDCRKTYTWPGSNWRPSASEADVIATRPQVLDCARLFCREMKNHCEGQGREGGGHRRISEGWQKWTYGMAPSSDEAPRPG